MPCMRICYRRRNQPTALSITICESACWYRQVTMPATTTQFFTGRLPFLSPNQQHQSTVHTLKGKWPKLSTPKLIHIYSTAAPRHALTWRSKVKVTLLWKPKWTYVVLPLLAWDCMTYDCSGFYFKRTEDYESVNIVQSKTAPYALKVE